MSSPPKFGAIVYSTDIYRLSKFYISMFEMTVQRETDEFVSISNSGFNLVIHTSPVQLTNQSFNRVKLFLTVNSLADSRQRAVELGGEALPGEWSNPLFKVCNIADSEGNHIQIREFAQ